MSVTAGQAVSQRLVTGFLAGALAVLVFHQAAILALGLAGVIPSGNAWSLRPNAWHVPVLVSGMFWGGLWGCLYALTLTRLPRPLWLGGLVFGVVGPALVGVWLVLPLLRGGPVFAGFAPARLLLGGVIHAVYGIGLALFYGVISRHMARRQGPAQ